MIYKKQISGFSLVELLVAMVVGTIIVTGAFSLYSGTRKTQRSSEAQMDMVADARFAIEMISYDLRHAGMWGGTNKDGLIECRSADTDCAVRNDETIPTTATNDCEDKWFIKLARPIFGIDDADGNPYSATCIPESEGYVEGTDIIEIRYADANLPAALTSGQTYVRSNFINGRIFIGETVPKLRSNDSGAGDPTTNNHRLKAYAYYVSDHTDSAGDGIPSLRRVALVSGPTVQNQTVISGVADLQVQYGVDSDGDLIIDRYVNADDLDETDWVNVYSAKIWLLMRSDKAQTGIDTTKSFRLAGKDAVDYGGDGGYRYFLVSSVVNLRNIRQL